MGASVPLHMLPRVHVAPRRAQPSFKACWHSLGSWLMPHPKNSCICKWPLSAKAPFKAGRG
eukprot:12266821-Heterocapsa_arctica.AAC.1